MCKNGLNLELLNGVSMAKGPGINKTSDSFQLKTAMFPLKVFGFVIFLLVSLNDKSV